MFIIQCLFFKIIDRIFNFYYHGLIICFNYHFNYSIKNFYDFNHFDCICNFINDFTIITIINFKLFIIFISILINDLIISIIHNIIKIVSYLFANFKNLINFII